MSQQVVSLTFLCLLPQQNTGNRRASTPTSELKGIREESEESEQGKRKPVTSANSQNDKEEVITCKSVNKTGGVEPSKYPWCRSEIYDFLVLQNAIFHHKHKFCPHCSAILLVKKSRATFSANQK